MVRKGPLPGAQVGPSINLGQVGGVAQTGVDIAVVIRDLEQKQQQIARNTVTTTSITNVDVFNVTGAGYIIHLYAVDNDTLAQNEFITLTVDGTVLLSDVSRDVSVNGEFTFWLRSLAENIWAASGIGDRIDVMSHRNVIKYTTSCRLQCRRAAAGVNGLTVTALRWVEI